jgi:Zn finger protein HypA/HybF involved in hydrogenase expression
MHEAIIVKDIIENAKKQGDVESIRIEIGEIAPVPKHELLECLKRFVDWKVDYYIKEAQVTCDCGFIGHPKILEQGHDFYLIECPKCGEVPEVTHGTKIILKDVVVK